MINTLADITRTHRAERPDEIALRVPHKRDWTFAQLDTDACICANALRNAGISEGGRIAFLARNEPEFFLYLYGGAKLGAVSVAVNWRLTHPEMEYILNHSEAEILLVGEEYLGHLKQMNLNLNQVVVLGDSGDSGYPTWDQWLSGHGSEDIVVDIDTEDTCFQLYTSGTTGLPKGVETTHANLITMMSQGQKARSFSTTSISLACMPLFHISGSAWVVLSQYSGCRSVLLRDVDLDNITRVIETERVTHCIFVPAILQRFATVPGIEDIDFSSLQIVCYGASPVTEEVLVTAMRLFNADFSQGYGLTETTGGVTMLSPDDHDPGGERAGLLRSCGNAIDNHEIRIVNPDTGEDMPGSEVGEIWIRGPQVMKGYWRNPEATSEAIDADGWFKSGDVGYMIDRYLYIHDRVKDMIISGGENIYPAEIENALMKHPEIGDAAVVGVPSERWGETVKAIITRGDDTLTEEGVISFCRQQLAHYKCPTSVDWMNEIPRNPSGKLLKAALRKPYWEGKDRNVS